MDLPPDKAKLLKQYDNEKKWDIICDQVSKAIGDNLRVEIVLVKRSNRDGCKFGKFHSLAGIKLRKRSLQNLTEIKLCQGNS